MNVQEYRMIASQVAIEDYSRWAAMDLEHVTNAAREALTLAEGKDAELAIAVAHRPSYTNQPTRTERGLATMARHYHQMTLLLNVMANLRKAGKPLPTL